MSDVILRRLVDCRYIIMAIITTNLIWWYT